MQLATIFLLFMEQVVGNKHFCPVLYFLHLLKWKKKCVCACVRACVCARARMRGAHARTHMHARACINS